VNPSRHCPRPAEAARPSLERPQQLPVQPRGARGQAVTPNYFTHDHAQYRAYRWGEDGLAGISDDRQLLGFALALWNGRDAILKERLFGLSNSEGNHGEDVKEYP
jgi:hypothetical protein